MKRFLLILSAILVLAIGAVFALPNIWKPYVLDWAKTQLNQRIDAKVDFADASLSWWKSFPNLSFSVDSLYISGVGQYDSVTLLEVPATHLNLNLQSVVNKKRPIEINSFELQDPKLIIIEDDSSSNYQLVESSTESPDSKKQSFHLKLKKYEIENADITYISKPNHIKSHIVGLDHSGKGDMTAEQFVLKTKTHIQAADVKHNGIAYLKQSQVNLKADVDVDQASKTLQLRDNNLAINDLEALFAGSYQYGDSMAIDMQFNVPDAKIKELLSLVPAIYQKHYDGMKAKGAFTLNGRINGAIDIDNKHYPAMNVSLKVNDAEIKYPDLPEKIEDLNLKANMLSQQGSLNSLQVDISDASLSIDEQKISSTLQLRDLMSNPHIKGLVKGDMDLSVLQKAIPVEALQKLDGEAEVDLDIDFRMNDAMQKNYDKIAFSGQAIAKDFQVQYGSYPNISVAALELDFSPTLISSNKFAGTADGGQFEGYVEVENPLAYFHDEAKPVIDAFFKADQITTASWMPNSTANDQDEQPAEVLLISDPLANLDLNAKVEIDKINHGEYQLTGSSANARYADGVFHIDRLVTKEGDTELQAVGEISNVWTYLAQQGDLNANLKVESPYINANDYMTAAVADSNNSTDASSHLSIAVPKHLKLQIDAEVGRFKYANYDLRNLSADVNVYDQQADITNGQASVFGGKMLIDGTYNTTTPTVPRFDLNYKAEGIDFSKAFAAVNTIKAIAPIGKYIDGSFNTELQTDGVLGENLMPDFSQLNLKGFLQTFNGVLKDFNPFEKLSDLLGVNAYEKMNLENSKNWVEIANGLMTIQPFEQEIDDIKMHISGSYAILDTLDFVISSAIPRSKFDQSNLAQQANKGLGMLEQQAKDLGLDFSVGDYVYVDARVTGKANDPKIAVAFKGSGGKDLSEAIQNEIEQQTDAIVDSIAQEVEQQKEEIAQQIDSTIADQEQKIASKIDSVQAEVVEKIDSALQNAVDSAASSFIDSSAREVLDSLMPELGVPTDSITDFLKDINPFKKKKKKKKSN